MTPYLKTKLHDYIQVLSSDSATPGGGSALATVCALGLALVEMAANVTVTKLAKKGETCPRLAEIVPHLVKLRKGAEEIVDGDTKAFEDILSAMRLAKDTPEQIEIRKQAMQNAYKNGAQSALSLMATAFDALPFADVCVAYADKFVVSDGIIGRRLLRSVIENSVHNVDINLDCIKDADFAAKKTQEKNKYLAVL